MFKVKAVILFVIFLESYGWALSLFFGSRAIVWIDDVIATFLLLIIVLFITYRKKIYHATLNAPLILFLAIFFVSALINNVEVDVSLMQLRSYILMISLYYFVLWSRMDNAEILSVLKFILLLFIPIIFSAIFEYMTGSAILVSQDRYGQDLLQNNVFRIHSLIGNPIDYANYAIIILSIMLPSVLLKYRLMPFGRIYNVIAVVLIFLTLFMANSKGPFLAVVLSFLLLTFGFRVLKNKEKRGFLIVPIILTVAMGGELVDRFFDPHLGSSLDYRMMYLIKTMEVFKDYPFFGVGPGMFGGWVSINYSLSYVYDLYGFSTDGISSIDMFFPHLIGELGLLGFLAYVLFFVKPFHYFLNYSKKSNTIEVRFISISALFLIFHLLIISWFSIALENQMIISMYFILIGLFENFIKNKENKSYIK